jgi:hypothetical protein
LRETSTKLSNLNQNKPEELETIEPYNNNTTNGDERTNRSRLKIPKLSKDFFSPKKR